MKKKLIILDTFASASTDLSYQPFEQLASITTYERTPYELIAQRIGDAQLLITNKCLIDRTVIEQCPNLNYIGVTATGYNNIDINAAQERGITVTNVANYSGHGVAQLVFAYILDAYNQVQAHHHRVMTGEWQSCPDFCFYSPNLQETVGKSIGIVGFGDIAQRVATLADAFDMQVLVYTRTLRDEDQQRFPQVTFCTFDDLLKQSDIITIHCPLTEQTKHLFGEREFAQMKSSATLINTARGPIIQEQALTDALNHNQIAQAYIDVVSEEPILKNNPLLTAKNITITPHIAWAAKQTRSRLITQVYQNLQHYLDGDPINCIV